MPRLTTLTALFVTALVLTACGKAGTPASPGPVGHPATYPNTSLHPAPVNKDPQNKPVPAEEDVSQSSILYTKDGLYIDPSARQRSTMGISTFVSQNIAVRSTTQSRNATPITDPIGVRAMDQPLLEPRQ